MRRRAFPRTRPGILLSTLEVDGDLGIGIASPALIFYRHFKNKVDTFVVEMEQRAGKLVDIVHGERSA